MSRKILITGGCGYIGDSVVKYLQRYSPRYSQDGQEVHVLDNLVYGGSYMRNVHFIRADITNQKLIRQILTENNYDSVIHLAALVGDGACAIDILKTVDTNLSATKNIVDICAELGIQLVFASTCSVYGANNDLLNENSSTNPLSTYAETKLLAEEYIRENLENYVIFRLGTLFGLSTEFARIRCDLVANILTYRAAQGDILNIHGGEQWRPLLHVRDAANAFAMTSLYDGANRIFAQGTYILAAENYRISDLAQEIIDVVGSGEIKSTPRAFEDLRNYKVDTAKCDGTIWRANITLKTGVREMLKVLREGRIADIWSDEFHNAKYIKAQYEKR